jgi:Uma2 family endonuclease
VANEVAFRITEHVKRNGLGRVFGNDTFVRVRSNPDTYRGPGVCFVSFAKLPKEAVVPEGPLELPPELVVEVRSPSDSVRAMTDKAYEYLEAGVRVAVVFDPPSESVGVFRAGELPQRFSNGDDLKLSDVLPGFSVPVRQFFG